MNEKNIVKIWFLQDFDLFQKLGRKHLLEVCMQLELMSVTKGEELLLKRENESVIFLLKTGTIKIVTQSGNYTKHIIKEGNIFGELSLIDIETDTPYKINESAIALEDAVVCSIEASQMKELMSQHDSLKNEVLKLYGHKVKKLERRLEDLLYKDSKTRITEYLFNYLSEFGVKNGDKLEAKNLLSHSDIAHLTNTSRQTVNNVMSALRKEGVIDYDSTIIQKVII